MAGPAARHAPVENDPKQTFRRLSVRVPGFLGRERVNARKHPGRSANACRAAVKSASKVIFVPELNSRTPLLNQPLPWEEQSSASAVV